MGSPKHADGSSIQGNGLTVPKPCLIMHRPMRRSIVVYGPWKNEPSIAARAGGYPPPAGVRPPPCVWQAAPKCPAWHCPLLYRIAPPTHTDFLWCAYLRRSQRHTNLSLGHPTHHLSTPDSSLAKHTHTHTHLLRAGFPKMTPGTNAQCQNRLTNYATKAQRPTPTDQHYA